MKTYKYWIFHLDPKYRIGSEPGMSTMYAYTDSKELANMFREQRDMEKFIVKKEELSRDQVNTLATDFNSYILEKHDGLCKVAGSDVELMPYSLALTRLENMNIDMYINRMKLQNLQEHAWTNPFEYKDKYVDSLRSLAYVYYYAIVCGRGIADGFDERFLIDKFQVFCDMYDFTTILTERV